MKMKPVPNSQYLQQWLEAKYVQASEGGIRVESSEKAIEFAEEKLDYDIGSTCAPTIMKSTKSGGKSSSAKSTKSMNMMNMKNMMGKGKGKGSRQKIWYFDESREIAVLLQWESAAYDRAAINIGMYSLMYKCRMW